jgi:hypothetical protein
MHFCFGAEDPPALAGCADRVYIRLFVRRGRGRGDVNEPDVIMLEASEIASMSIRTVEVFLYGPKPNVVEWLVIEPAQAVAKDVSDRTRPLCGLNPALSCMRPIDPSKQVFVSNVQGPLTIEWKWCRPALRMFLQQVAQQCPSVVIAPEQRLELDLNGIWNGVRWAWRKPDVQERQLLVQAMRLGFGCKCARLLSLYRDIPFREAGTYLAEIEQEEAAARQ